MDMDAFPPGQWVVYILRCGDDSLYTGVTNNLAKRINEHVQGTGARYTRSHLPVNLAYVELVEGKSQALKREIAIKRLPRAQKLVLLMIGSQKGE
ncbi:GIY-YIG nuclease family protein [Chitinivorax sp. B]|uniref:GIY-YIG nuclease family protein n=1 Tax=Chitinivorax sp. B TaxID=2502235 RepID=UPI0010F97B5D|nr:GIY-YIG nuclease family protein [Chitinivorax sp. B]